MEGRRLVSVIVPTRDRPALLRKALASIRALEGPDLCFEILVGDNGASPETKPIVAEFGGIYLPISREGPAAARNAALRAATGEFFAFLDDDDEWTPQNIRPHIAIFDAKPDIAAAFGQIVYVTPDDLRPIGEPWPEKWPGARKLFVTMLGGYYPQLGATVARASILASIGLMDESLIGDEDWDWQLRIARAHRAGFVDRPCVFCRTRPAGSYDEIQILRIQYCAKVFWRHALPNLARWRSPLGFARTYYGAVSHYHRYFVDAAVERAKLGDRKGARRAISHAFRVNPVRTVLWMLKPPLRSAVATTIFGGSADAAGKAELQAE